METSKPLPVYVRTRPGVAEEKKNVFKNAHSLVTGAGTSRRASLALTNSHRPRRRSGEGDEAEAEAEAEAKVKDKSVLCVH